MEDANTNPRELPDLFNKLWVKLKYIFTNELVKKFIVMPIITIITTFITGIFFSGTAKFSNPSDKTGLDFFTDIESNVTFSLFHLLILASIFVLLFIYINWNSKQTFNSFRAFDTNIEGFKYFENRIKEEKVDSIDVTYFQDYIDEREEESDYFRVQNTRIKNDKNFKVRRIILIKSDNDYRKMEELITKVGKQANFALGCYVLEPTEERKINNKKEGEIKKKEGAFIDYLHFNFMVMGSQGSKEICLNNGNKDIVDPSGYMVSIKNVKLAEAFKHHFDYLFLKSYQIKSFTITDINEDVKKRIDEDCRKKGII
jgi:hypothetical protein